MSERPKESVWDYPRPPAVDPVNRHICASVAGHVIIDTEHPIRVLETSHPPVYYIPPQDVAMQFLVPSRRVTFCEFKGEARYYSLVTGGQEARPRRLVLP